MHPVLCTACAQVRSEFKRRTGSSVRVMDWKRIGAGLLVLLCVVEIADGERPGDANCNNGVAVDDVLSTATQLFFDPPWPCLSVDGNYDGRLTAADVPAIAREVAAPPALGPVISYLGLASADGTPFSPREVVQGLSVYQRPAGQGFKLVIEAKPGANGVSVGKEVFRRDPWRPEVRPDLWVLVSARLGDGSREVCDGGVPPVHPPDFRPRRLVTDAINDLGCHVTVATSPAFACTQDRFGRGAFVGDGTQVQFCLEVSRALIFSDGETLVTVRVRDVAGTLGPLQQIRVRVGPGPFPPSPTPTATPTVTQAAGRATRTPSASPTASRNASSTATRTASATRSPSLTRVPSVTPTRTQTAGASSTASPTEAPTRPPSASATFAVTRRSPTATPSSPSASPSATPVSSPTFTRSASPTRTVAPPSWTRTSSPTATVSPTRSATPTRTRTRTTSPSPTASRTPTAGRGPVITFFGLTRADDTLLEPVDSAPDGAPIYVRPQGFGFNIVIEAGRGSSGAVVGQDTFVPSLDSMPDLQIVASRALGDGSEAVCDAFGPNAGGVPAVDPPVFASTPDLIRAVNDFACRFVDGAGNPRGRGSADACTRVPPEQDFRFVRDSESSVQFCAPVTRPFEFPPGDTVLTARVLDRESADIPPGRGNPGPTARIIVRVGQPVSPSPSPSPTSSPTRTVTPPSTLATASSSPTRTVSRTPTSGPTTLTVPPTAPSPTRTRTPTRTATRSATPTGSATPSPTPGSIGPVVTFFGVARADGLLVPARETSPEGVPIFTRPLGAGFTLVIEGKPGSSGRPVGSLTYRSDLAALPDLQIVASRELGDGSPRVCDLRPPEAGGVPAVDPPRFDDLATVNDLACRFRDGVDQPLGRTAADACVQFENGSFGFVAPDSTLQFCALVDRAWSFPPGDTLLTVRLRDTNGNVGPLARIIIRIAN